MFRVIITLFVLALIIKLLAIIGRAIFKPFKIILDGLEKSQKERERHHKEKNNLNKYIAKSFVVTYPYDGWSELIFKTKEFVLKNALVAEGDLDISHLVGRLMFEPSQALSISGLKAYDRITVTSVYNKSRIIQVALEDGAYGFMEASVLDKMTLVTSQDTKKPIEVVPNETNKIELKPADNEGVEKKIIFPSSVKVPIGKENNSERGY